MGCPSVLFLSTPAASKSAHICILITWVGLLLAWAPFRVFTLLIPCACGHPYFSQASHHRGHHTDGTAHIGRKNSSPGSKVVDGALFKMASRMPPVKCSSSGPRDLGYISTASCPVLSPLGSTWDRYASYGIRELSRVQPHGIDGSINPIPAGCVFC